MTKHICLKLPLACLVALAAFDASAAKELVMSRDGSTDPSETAVITTERMAGGSIFGQLAWLLFITDLSLPPEEQRPIKLYSSWSAVSGKYARVSPGKYRVVAGCDSIAFKQQFNIDIDAKPGKMYLLTCAGSLPRSASAHYREQDQPAKSP